MVLAPTSITMSKKLLSLLVCAGLGAQLGGCGTILYPERRGTTGGQVDGGVLVMDCLWLLAGVVPGVVFLIVDFSNGAIYRSGR